MIIPDFHSLKFNDLFLYFNEFIQEIHLLVMNLINILNLKMGVTVF